MTPQVLVGPQGLDYHIVSTAVDTDTGTSLTILKHWSPFKKIWLYVMEPTVTVAREYRAKPQGE